MKAAAHAIQNDVTFIPQLHEYYHGCTVVFCTLVQLAMEEAWKEVSQVLQFCTDVGLPVCFSDMSYEAPDQELLQKAAEKACVAGSAIHHMPFSVTPQMILKAMLRADEIGKAYKVVGILRANERFYLIIFVFLIYFPRQRMR